MRRRRVRYKGVPVPGWLADLTGALLVLAMLLALVSGLVDWVRSWLGR